MEVTACQKYCSKEVTSYPQRASVRFVVQRALDAISSCTPTSVSLTSLIHRKVNVVSPIIIVPLNLENTLEVLGVFSRIDPLSVQSCRPTPMDFLSSRLGQDTIRISWNPTIPVHCPFFVEYNRTTQATSCGILRYIQLLHRKV